MKNKFKKMVLAISAMGFIATATVANAIPFTITAKSFTQESGYGVDGNESNATLLDVKFSTGIFGALTTPLDLVGDSFTFLFGTVDLQEPNARRGIIRNETDNLNMKASFTFTDPLLGANQNVQVIGTGTAITGSVSDAAMDYTLVWEKTTVHFGSGGVFEILMNPLTFYGRGSQYQMATITLLDLPDLPNRSLDNPAVTDTVPEPATLALLGLGLFYFAASNRKTDIRKYPCSVTTPKFL